MSSIKAKATVAFTIEVEVSSSLSDDNNLKTIKADVAERARELVQNRLGEQTFVQKPTVTRVTLIDGAL